MNTLNPTSYLDKSPDASRMGAAAEYLIAATCILASRGHLNVSKALVDDEGVDLVFHQRGGSRTLAVQVKARMADAKHVSENQQCRVLVRSQTFRPRPDLDLLVVVVDPYVGAVRVAWLVPSEEFARVGPKQDSRGRFKFVASMKTASRDRWVRFRLDASELASRVLERLRELE